MRADDHTCRELSKNTIMKENIDVTRFDYAVLNAFKMSHKLTPRSFRRAMDHPLVTYFEAAASREYERKRKSPAARMKLTRVALSIAEVMAETDK